jgi:hypothetical protein
MLIKMEKLCYILERRIIKKCMLYTVYTMNSMSSFNFLKR